MPELRTDRVRLTILIYRKEGISTEDFHTYWRTKHAGIFTGIAIVKKNLLRYEQAHINATQVGHLKPLGFPVPDFDGMATFEAESYEKIMECFMDEEYNRVVVPDEESFLDRKRSVAVPLDLMVGLGE